MATILIVEDEPLIRLALAYEFIDAGNFVIECSNVLEAIAAFGRNDIFDAVVTDVDMPGGLSGLDLVKLLRATRPSIPIWVTSGRSVDLSEFDNSLTFVPKPYNMGALAERVISAEMANKIQTRANAA